MKKFLSLFLLTVLLTACETTTEPIVDAPKGDDWPVQSEPTDSVYIALVAMEDNGENGELVGCGDSIVLVEKKLEETSMDTAPTASLVMDALDALFDIEDSTYGESGLYNALPASDIIVNSVSYSGTTLLVDLGGSIISAGTCDDPRIEQQIRSTVAANAPEGTEITIWFDGEDLHEYFDMSGGQE